MCTMMPRTLRFTVCAGLLAAGSAAADQGCLPPPYTDTLFIRGMSIDDNSPRQDHAFQYRCNA